MNLELMLSVRLAKHESPVAAHLHPNEPSTLDVTRVTGATAPTFYIGRGQGFELRYILTNTQVLYSLEGLG